MRSISKTITVAIIVWIGLILALGQFVIDKTVSGWLERQFNEAIEAKARALVTLTSYQHGAVELHFADEFMPEFEAAVDPEYFELFLDDGSLLERSNSFDGHPESVFADQSEELLISDVMLPDGRDGRRISIKYLLQLEDEDEVSGNGPAAETPSKDRPRAIVRISRERESLEQTRLLLHVLVLGITLCILLAVVIGVPRLTRRGLQPLLKMKQEIGRITPQAMDRRVTVEGQPEEIEPIARQFNLVLDEIEKAFTRERQFSSDVAHELRTPVAEIRSLAEVGLRWPDEKNIQSYFGDIHESAQHLNRLIENLMHVSRGEDGTVNIVSSDVNLGKLIAGSWLSLENDYNNKDITVTPPCVDLPDIVTDPQWFGLILLNLFFNAISHSPEGASIYVDCRFDAEFCRLQVRNAMATPLTEADIEQCFQRFWRKDPARESGHHTGIGLSLVKTYSELMGIGVDAWVSGHSFHIELSNIRLASVARD